MTKKQAQEHHPAPDYPTPYQYYTFPREGLVRLSQIVGDRKRGIPPFVAMSKSAWWAGVASGKFPQPVKLAAKTTCWQAEQVRLFAKDPVAYMQDHEEVEGSKDD